ncbi:hypothetical protein [Thermodesulfatator atlanticus]
MNEKSIFRQFVLVFLLVLVILFLAMLSYYALENPLNRNKIFSFAKYFFLWEALLAISVSYIFYRLFAIYERYKKDQEEFLSLLVKTLSHRFGNFISAQKLGLNVLSQKYHSKSINTLIRSCNLMEHDLRHLLVVLDSFLERKDLENNVTISALLKESRQQYAHVFGEKTIKVSSFKEPKFFKRTEACFVMALLLENAYRYGKSFIWLRAGRYRGISYLALINDLGDSHPPPGTGLGLYLAKRFAARAGLEIATKKNENHYISLIYEKSSAKHLFLMSVSIFQNKK